MKPYLLLLLPVLVTAAWAQQVAQVATNNFIILAPFEAEVRLESPGTNVTVVLDGLTNIVLQPGYRGTIQVGTNFHVIFNPPPAPLPVPWK